VDVESEFHDQRARESTQNVAAKDSVERGFDGSVTYEKKNNKKNAQNVTEHIMNSTKCAWKTMTVYVLREE
jgi:hypothetical protein